MNKHFAASAIKSFRLGIAAVVAAVGLGAVASPAAAAVAPRVIVTSHRAPALTVSQKLNLAKHPFRRGQMRPIFLVKPPYVAGALTRQRSALVRPMSGVNTVPFWTTHITSPRDHLTYTVDMVGSSPLQATPVNRNVSYVPIILRIHMGGIVVDPTVVSPCDTESPAQRFFDSPLFQPATNIFSNGVNVSTGGQQLVSAFQRADFWTSTQGTTYGVTLVPTRTSPIIIDWAPWQPTDFVGSFSDECGQTEAMPNIDIGEYDAELQMIAARWATPTQIPVIMSLNVAIYTDLNTNHCCVLGYHNAVPLPSGVQLYATGAYFDSANLFGVDYQDISTWTHEISELVADPFVQSIPTVPGGTSANLTPAWGHTGQVSGCQNNLETGDPLSSDQIGNFHDKTINEGGFHYHYQDLAFHSWFYRSHSTGTGGKFSFNGNFVRAAGAIC
ncbi:MAG TPA: hypothetical protein VFE13_01150 [Caulobacteraceae bacterium]|jgi:hypothetical protein|nr:hypothetical protein [Caulobacteraceae bacterium]